MNDTIKTILSRRSIRSYKQEQIKEEELELILEAAKYAPTGMNNQPWHFAVVQNREILDKINSTIRNIFLRSENKSIAERAGAEDFTVFYHAPILIIVAADEKAATPQFDSALALGNMFLAAESLGIGSCWIHSVSMSLNLADNMSLIRELGIPEGYKVFGAGVFGYKASEAPAPGPRKEGTVNIIK